MTPEQIVAEAITAADHAHITGLTIDGLIWLEHRATARANAALDAVRAALNSGDPEVVRAMAERVGLELDVVSGLCSQCVHSYDHDGVCDSRRTEVSVRGPWREVPDADA